MTEFNLSEKEIWVDYPNEEFFYKKDVKEFIRLLKKFKKIILTETVTKGKSTNQKGYIDFEEFMEKLDKLAGEKLI